MKSNFFIGNGNSIKDRRRHSTPKNVSFSPVIRDYYNNYLVSCEANLNKNNLFIDGVNDVSNNSISRRELPYSTPDPTFINKSSMEGLILPNGIISGSSQLTSSLDQRYIVCGTVNINSYLDNYIFIGSGSFGG